MTGVEGAVGIHAMVTQQRRVRPRIPLVATAIAVAMLAVAGCSAEEPDDTASPSPSASRAPSPSAEPDATATPAPSPTPSETPSDAPGETAAPEPSAAPLSGQPVGLRCDELLTAQDVYDYNPNVGTDPGYRPRAGSGPEQTNELSGIACGWLNQTSGQTYSIGAARFDSAELPRVRAMVERSGGDSLGGGLDGSYRVESGVGIIDVFFGSYWVSAESSAFLSADDARPLLDSIERNLP